jgi:hypothetical protein
MLRTTAIVALLATTAVCAACSSYLEQTPAGFVPPPRSIAPIQPAPAMHAQEPEDLYGGGGDPFADPWDADTNTDAVTQDPDFTTVYREIGYPRMIVFATHSFNGDVNTWLPKSRTVGEVTTSVGGQPALTSTADRSKLKAAPIAAYQPTADEIAFERTFIAAMVRAGVSVIDRDVILRQEALKHHGVDAMKQVVLSQPVVEAYALNNNVEILVTIDLLGDQALPCTDRRFFAAAKRMGIGDYLASIDSAVSVPAHFPTVEYVATEHGYERRDVSPQYSCAELAEVMAGDLMDALARRFDL